MCRFLFFMYINTVLADLSISKQGTVFYLQMHAKMSVCLLIPWRRLTGVNWRDSILNDFYRRPVCRFRVPGRAPSSP
jgi:hypothetical protein